MYVDVVSCILTPVCKFSSRIFKFMLRMRSLRICHWRSLCLISPSSSSISHVPMVFIWPTALRVLLVSGSLPVYNASWEDLAFTAAAHLTLKVFLQNLRIAVISWFARLILSRLKAFRLVKHQGKQPWKRFPESSMLKELSLRHVQMEAMW